MGKPQAVLSEEDLAMKEANRTGQTYKGSESRKNRSRSRRSLGPSWSRNGAVNGEDMQFSIGEDGMSNLEMEDMVVPTAKRGMILPFEPLSISFDDVSYFVDMPPVNIPLNPASCLSLSPTSNIVFSHFILMSEEISSSWRAFHLLLQEMKQEGVTEDRLKLLSNITGAFRPGVLTALVGVSGAGKTTLMDVLAGRKTGGYIEGDTRISGYPKNQKTFSRISGYCEQNDIHSPQVTVRESLIYSAWLRLSPDVDSDSKMVRQKYF